MAEELATTRRSVVIDDTPISVLVAGAGKPTIVFLSGLSCGADAWEAVAPATSRHARVVLYDRPGTGQSQATALPRTLHTMTTELHSLLAACRLAPPFLLVGHSFGGMLARSYALYYPYDVAGLVLVDTPHEATPEEFARHLPPAAWYDYLQPWNSKGVDLPSSFAALQAAIRVLDVPTTVLTAAEHHYPADWPHAALETTRLRLQASFHTQLPNTTQHRVEGTGHNIHIERPELVIAAVAELLARLRIGL